MTNEQESSRPGTAHWGLLGTTLWSLLLAFIFLVTHNIVPFVTVLKHRGLTESQFMELLHAATRNGTVISLAIFLGTAVCGPLLLGMMKLKRGATIKEYLCIRPVPVKSLLKWIGFLFILAVAADAGKLIMGEPIVPPFVIDTYTTADPAWLLWLAFILAAPLLEEAFFRGFLFKGLEASVLKPVGAIVFTSLLWASIHVQYDLYDVTFIFAVGILLGFARWRTNSIVTPLITRPIEHGRGDRSDARSIANRQRNRRASRPARDSDNRVF